MQRVSLFCCNTKHSSYLPTQIPQKQQLGALTAKCLFTNVMLEYIINKIKYKYPAVVPKK